jgi:hypothetical protein
MKLQAASVFLYGLLALCLLFPQYSKADASTPVGDIMVVHMWEGHTGILVRVSTMINPDACANPAYMILRDSYPHYKELYALLLASVATSKQIVVTVGGCYEGFPAIKNIWMYK